MTGRELANRAPDVGGAHGPLSVGVGLRPGADGPSILAALRECLGDSEIGCLATIDRRGSEPGLIAVAEELRVPIVVFPAAELAKVPVPASSSRVAEAVGTASVAEAAALLAAADGTLIVPKRVVGDVTVAAAH
ncbi:cobalamin biosynthesis protein [Nocardia sp. BMG111209]|uniref:cobalamin biosynthesis protein n=1 Tax=Nocardia sp. BMG111209 TaxID=1160137 RepID=UPI0003A97E10|nr:cobalamin biosynthesis protein [Nocardia sp. BMG111209]